MRSNSRAAIMTLALTGLAACIPNSSRTGTFTHLAAFDIAVETTGSTAGSLYVVVDDSSHTPVLARADAIDASWTILAPTGVKSTGMVRTDPFTAGSLFVLGSASPNTGLVLRSDDRGTTWTQLAAGLPAPSDPDSYLSIIAPDPAVAGRVWLGYAFVNGKTGSPLFRSDDRGATWTQVGSGLGGTRVFSIAFDAAGPLLAATETGISTSSDAGATWRDLSQGIPRGHGGDIRIAADSQTPGRAYANVLGEVLRIDAGGSWTPVVLDGFFGTPGVLATDPLESDRFFLGGSWANGTIQAPDHNGLFLSTDAGDHARPSLGGTGFVTAVFASPTSSLVVATTLVGIWASTDRGATWHALNDTGLPYVVDQPGL